MSDYPNARDCEHGRLRRRCELCDCERENDALRSQVERYREVVTFALGVLRSSTMTWEQRGAVTYDALARLDADPPREPTA